MVIKVKVPDELATQARARGLQPEAYAEEILARQVGTELRPTGRIRTPAELRSWLDALAQFSDKIPPLPDTISREWIYQDRD
jgi:post-segregation antitoxin (ccd killing protein)